MARKTFTTRGEFKPQGRRSTFFGQKAHSKFKGGGFTVTYESCQRNKREALCVTVTIEGHKPASWVSLDLVPSPETAKIAAAAAFRAHFGHGTGDPHDHEGRALAFCKCNSEKPAVERQRASLR